MVVEAAAPPWRDDYYTHQEVADLLDTSAKSVYRLTAGGRLTYYLIGESRGGFRLYPKQDVHEYILALVRVGRRRNHKG